MEEAPAAAAAAAPAAETAAVTPPGSKVIHQLRHTTPLPPHRLHMTLSHRRCLV